MEKINIRNKKTDKSKKTIVPSSTFRVIALGGLEEIGKNFTVFECDDDIIIVDCGIKFPDDEMYGIDFVIPDFSYLEGKEDKIRGIFITHGHEDHIGSIPFFIKRFGNKPIYGTKLTIGLLGNKLTEHNLDKNANLHVVHYGSTITVKGFTVEFITTNHSIADSSALYIKCKAGSIFHTGDFKIDLTPVDNQRINLARMAQIGTEGVDLMLSDSTNAEKKGYTPSEKTVGDSFNLLFSQAGKKRIVIASFSTNIHRIQQIFDTAKKYKRKVAVAGRSMLNVLGVAKELKYLKFNDNILIDINTLGQYQDEQIVLLTTGSQGEPMSALSRMANGEHRVKLSSNDFVIISATPIPGNEKTVAEVTNNLVRLGATVINSGSDYVHVSGHACQEELKILQGLIKPRNFMPCHGEYKMLYAHAQLAKKMGLPEDNIFVMQNGDVLEIGEGYSQIVNKINVGITLVDGAGIGDIGNIVLKDRKKLSEGGLFVVAATIGNNRLISGPDIISRGFIYVRESTGLMNEAKTLCQDIINSLLAQNADISTIKSEIKSSLDIFLYGKTLRKPIVMPIITKASLKGDL